MAGEFDIEIYYRFTRADTGVSVDVKRDAAPASIVGVGGRWNVVPRPRRTSFVTWDGSDPYTMDVPILFDGWDLSRSQEKNIALLNHFSISPSDFAPPPQVYVDGALPVTGAVWVLSPQISWGTNVIWHEDGYRLRQDAIVHLLQFVEAEALSIKPPATSHTVATGGRTLKQVSRDEYGTTKYWSAIQKANNIRDPKKLPKTLRIPAIVNP